MGINNGKRRQGNIPREYKGIRKYFFPEKTMKKLYGILWGQTSERKRVKVQAVDKFKEIEEIQDPVKLELVLRQVAYNVQYKTYFPLSEWTINQRLHLPRQDKGM